MIMKTINLVFNSFLDAFKIVREAGLKKFYFLPGIISLILFGIFVYSPVHEMLGITNWGSWFFDGLLASGAVWAINAIVEWFEENR